MLWMLIFYFSLPAGQYEGPVYKSSFQYLAFLPCIFLMVVTLIQKGKSCNPGRVLNSPAPCCWWLWWKCFSFSMRWNAAVSSMPLPLITKQLWYFLPSHLVFSVSQGLRLLARIWLILSRDVLLKCLLRSVKLVFLWSSVVKSALYINGGGCSLSSIPFELPGIWLPRWSSGKGCAGSNLVVATEPPILDK